MNEATEPKKVQCAICRRGFVPDRRFLDDDGEICPGCATTRRIDRIREGEAAIAGRDPGDVSPGEGVGKHTPGSWKIVGTPKAFTLILAQGLSLLVKPQGRKIDESEMLANGHLLEAAPDLLAACEFARDVILGGDSIDGVESWAQTVCSRLGEAINKAYGRSIISPPASPEIERRADG